MVANGQLPPPRQPLLIPSQRGSQAMSEQVSRENSAVYITPAGGYYAPHGFAPPGQAQMQLQQQMQMVHQGYPIGASQVRPQSRNTPLAQATVPQAVVPQAQQAKSEEGSSQNDNGDGSGYQTPRSQPSEAANGYHAVSTDDPDAIRPLPPVRAPGHIYSPRNSIAQSNSNSS
jgi:hypothetical protein